MKASSGAYYPGLDHLRGLAAFLVFSWHFLHGNDGYPLAFGQQPGFFPAAIIDEGHCGVALFMTLSGYLFAKLLDGKDVHYGWFLWNRVLRLCPLLFAVLAFRVLRTWMIGGDLPGLARSLWQGLVLPTLPGGAWSITVEAHFYLLLPLLLAIFRRNMAWAFVTLLAALALRSLIYLHDGKIFELAHLTLVGRIDQFVLGMIAFHYRAVVSRQLGVLLGAFLAYAAFYYYFDRLHAYYMTACCYDADPLWIVLPTIDGVFFALLIASYDSIALKATGISRFFSAIGEYSYSIYLLHFFLVFKMAAFVDHRLLPLRNFYVTLAAALCCFVLMVPIAAVSYHLIEKPAMRFRRNYLRTRSPLPVGGAVEAIPSP
jgi:peptidoglycan/LPS O-acetylase OafA/YrhL